MSTISEHFEEVQSEEGSVDGDALEGHQEESVVFSEEQEEEGLEVNIYYIVLLTKRIVVLKCPSVY